MKRLFILLIVSGGILIALAFTDSFFYKIFLNQTFKSILILTGIICNALGGYLLLKSVREDEQ